MAEEYVVKQLMDNYEEEKLPILFLYLKAYNQEEKEEMEKGIKSIFKNIDFIPVIAKDIINTDNVITHKKGLNEIKAKTISRFGESINSMSFIHIQNKVNQKVTQKVDNLRSSNEITNITNAVYEILQKLIGEIDDDSINIIKGSVEEIKKLFENFDFREDILNYIEQFKIEFFKKDKKEESKKRKLNIDEKKEFDIISNELKKELEYRYNQCKINSNLNLEIYDYFLKIIKRYCKTIVNESLKNIKTDLKKNLKNAIKNNKNFKELLNNK